MMEIGFRLADLSKWILWWVVGDGISLLSLRDRD